MSQYDTRHPSDFMSSSSSNQDDGRGRDILFSALNLHKDSNNHCWTPDEEHRINRTPVSSSSSDRWPAAGQSASSLDHHHHHHHGNGGASSQRSRISSCLSPGGIFAHHPNDLVAPHRSAPPQTRTMYPPGGQPSTQALGQTHPSGTDRRRSSPLELTTGGEVGGSRKGPTSSSSVNRVKSYHCRLCDQEFLNKSDMQQHSKNVHRLDYKGHKCTKCFKSFPSSQQLVQHLLVHTNVRKYLCRFCDKAFKQLSHVQQHQRIHTGERPYKCAAESCSKAFRQLSSLQQHLKGHNIVNTKSYPVAHSSSSPLLESSTVYQLPSNLARPHDLTCQVCEKHCADEIRFFHHIHKYHADYWKVFSGGRPLSDFIESREMKRREKPYRCAVCSKCYSHENGYVKHLATHPDSLPDVRMQLFSCAVCDKFFTKEAYLLRHMEMKPDEQHCAGLEQLKKNSSMFRPGIVETPGTMYPGDPLVGMGRVEEAMGSQSSYQNVSVNPTGYPDANTTAAATSSTEPGPSFRPMHLIPHRHDPYHDPHGSSSSSRRQDVVQLKVDPGSPPMSKSSTYQTMTNPRSGSSHMIDVGSPGSSASGNSCSPSHLTYPSEPHSGFDGLGRGGPRVHDKYPLRLQSPGCRAGINPSFDGKALNTGADQVPMGPYYTQSYRQPPRTHLPWYLSDPLHCSTEDNGCYISSPFSYLPHFQGLPTTTAPSGSLPGRMAPIRQPAHSPAPSRIAHTPRR